MHLQKVTCYLRPGEPEVLKKLALTKGCIVSRGSHSGEGSISKLLQAIAQGKLTVVRLGKP